MALFNPPTRARFYVATGSTPGDLVSGEEFLGDDGSLNLARVGAFDENTGTIKTLLVAGTPSLGSPNTQTTDYTLVLGDNEKVVEVNAATAKNLTVPPNSSVAFPVGARVIARQLGVGQVTVVAGAGVTVRSRGTALKMAGQYAEATLIKRATDEWVLSGDVTP